MTDSYKIFYNKLNKFITKYHLIKLIQKIILGLTLIILILFLIILANYFFYFSISAKKIIFFTSIILYLAIFIEYMLIPALPFFNIKRITHYNAAKIISRLDENIQDKVINILELANDLEPSPLVLASIDQKINSLKILDFSKLISIKTAINYAKYLISIIIVLILLLLLNPQIIKIGAKKYVNYQHYYSPPAPISFILLNKDLKTYQNHDFTVKIKIKGKFIPENVFIIIEGNEFLMEKISGKDLIFHYTIKNLNQNIYFRFKANKYYSPIYTLEVLPVPQITDFFIKVIPPKYTKLPSEEFNNITELKVAYGSIVKFQFKTKNIDSIYFKTSSISKLSVNKNLIPYSLRITKPVTIEILGKYKNITRNLLKIKISIIPDQFPTINVNQFIDSNNLKIRYFIGQISDDYGFSKLTFNYQIDQNQITSINVPINKNIINQPFGYTFDFSKLNLSSDNKVIYYFEIFDNDYISGYKSTKSRTFIFQIPSIEQISESLDSSNSIISKNLIEAKQLSEQIQQEIEQLQQQLLNQKLTNWQKQSILKNIQQKQQQLEEIIKQTINQYQQINNQLNSFIDQSFELMQKREQIKQLLDQLLNDELKQLIEKLNQLLENINDPQFENKLRDLKLDYKQLSKSLDQKLELLKRLAIEQEINQQTQILENLAKKQDSLARLTKKKKLTNEQLLKEQQNINQSLKNLEQSYKQTIESNKTLEKPLNLKDFSKDFQQIQQNLQQASNYLQKGNTRKAAKLQKKAAQQMQQLAQKMQQMMQTAQMKANLEDLSLLYKLQNDLLEFSFSIEDIYIKTKQIYSASSAMDKILNDLKHNQLKFKIIQDSLESLSKRNPQISKPINDEIRKINQGLNKATDNLVNRKKNQALTAEHYILTATNNLALLLSEVIKQIERMMQNASATGKQGQQQMANMPSLKQLQQQLEKQLEQMIQQLEQAQKQGKKQQLNSEQLAKALAEEEMFRRMLEQFMQNTTLNPQTTQKLNEIKKMLDDVKKDIIYGNITPETIKRQKQIRVKLLEAEKALKEQEFDKKRQAQTAINYKTRNPANILKQYKKQISQKELLQLNTIKLNNYYRNIYSNYINLIR